MKAYYDSRHRSQPVPPLNVGQKVFVKDSDKAATVVKHHDTPRSYIVATDKGELRRTSQHLKPVPEDPNVTRFGRAIKPPDKLTL